MPVLRWPINAQLVLLFSLPEGEEVSEEENSGEEENFSVLNPAAVKKDGEKRKRKKPNTIEARWIDLFLGRPTLWIAFLAPLSHGINS